LDHDATIEQLKQELKSSELRTRQIMANIPAGLLVVNQGTIEAANSVIERMFNCQRSELARKPLSLLFPELENQPGHPILQYDESTPSSEAHLYGCKKDGQRFPCEVTRVAVSTSAGARLFVFVSDITERHELEELKRDFVAMVSHDLNTPLSSVKLCLEAIETGMYGEIQQDGLVMIDKVKVNVDRLISLINDLLCMDKLESGTLQIHRIRTTLPAITERAMGAIFGLSEAKKISVNAVFSGTQSQAPDLTIDSMQELIDQNVATEVLLDEDRMVQVIVNLLSNAIKFSPTGSEINLHAWLAAGEICFAIVDHGIGIADPLKQTVFEKYKQLDRFGSLDQSRVKGFGLGLAICKSIVQQHSGRIWVEDTPFSGCTFQIRIPAKA